MIQSTTRIRWARKMRGRTPGTHMLSRLRQSISRLRNGFHCGRSRWKPASVASRPRRRSKILAQMMKSEKGNDTQNINSSQQERPLGTVAVFSRQAQQIVVTLPDGDTLVYPAANKTLNPCGDPNRVDSNGPAPNGTFPVQRSVPMGDESYGPYFYPIGAVGARGERLDIARQRGIGLHAGRDSYLHPTHGCIRMNNRDIVDLHNQTQNVPLQVITIGD